MKSVSSSRKSAFEVLRPILSKLAAAAMLILIVISSPLHTSEPLKETLELSGFVLLIMAGIGRIWCSLHIAGRKDKILCTSGPYSLCRNPLYFFSFVGLVGFVISTSHGLITLVAAITYLVYYHFIIKDEELRLQGLFGEDFTHYCQNTNRFFLALKKPQKVSESQPVSYHVFEKSLRDVSGFFVAIILVEAIELVQKIPGVVQLRLPF